jgi:hypothetical protein
MASMHELTAIAAAAAQHERLSSRRIDVGRRHRRVPTDPRRRLRRRV